MDRSARSLPARVARVAREDGFAGLRRRALDATFQRRLIITGRSLGETRPERGEILGPSEVHFSFLVLGAIDDYASFRPDTPPSETVRRLAEGQLCLIGRRDGEIVHARWFAEERLESRYLGLAFALCSGVVYVHDVFTSPAARKLRISVNAAPHYEEVLRKRGAQTLIGSVWPGNSAGLAMIQAQGQQPIGTLAAFRLGRARIALRRGMPDGYVGAAACRFPR